MSEVNDEYLIVDAIVCNRTSWPMRLTGSNLSWGKWVQTPIDVPPNKDGKFVAQGRDSSPSGTTGWAEWVLEGHPSGMAPKIRVTFDNPAVGPDKVSITCEPRDLVHVQAVQTRGNHNYVTYTIG